MRRNHHQWRALIEEQRRSGLKAAEFCRHHGINPKYFSLKKSKLSEAGSMQSNFGFIRVPVSATSESPAVPRIEIRYKEATLSLPSDVSAPWLAEFVRALSP